MGLILNPQAVQEELWMVSFGNMATAPEEIKGGEWFGEFEDGFANYRAALAAVGELSRQPQPDGVLPYDGWYLTPVWYARPSAGVLVVIPKIPYAGCWDGGESFSQSICVGNYVFGAEITGDREPVWVDYGGVSPIMRRAWYARSNVQIRTWAGDAQAEYSLPVGTYWLAGRDGQPARPFYRVFPALEAPVANGLVDIEGRW